MTMTQMDDTMRKVTLGDPDGPMKFIEELGKEVPTYIDERLDLISKNKNTAARFKRVSHHVPFNMRGDFKPEQWPEQYQRQAGKVRVDIEGFVLCCGTTKQGALCNKRASNRTHFCQSHGGALHPADKKLSVDSIVKVPDRIEQMDRVQKFLQGFLKADELDDDEIQGNFVRNDRGLAVPAKALGIKFEQALAKELHSRLNKFLQSKASSMLHVMVDIAENDLYEAADRVKAATWVAERVMGKNPEIIIHGKTDQPYETILAGITSGSREDHRQKIEATRIDLPEEIVEVEILEDTDIDSKGNTSVRSEVSDGSRLHSGTEMVESQTALDSAEAIEENRKSRIAAIARIKKAKQRRFAARAVGASSLSRHPWLVDFRRTRKGSGFRAILVAPENQTPALTEKILQSYEDMRNMSEADWEAQDRARRIAEADADVVRLQKQLDKVRGN